MWMVVFVVLMVLWLAWGFYAVPWRDNPGGLGGTLIPWACVAILGWQMFGGGEFPARPAPAHIVVPR